MISSKVLAAAERNTRECIYRGQNSSEIWGGLHVVLLFGDDYQLTPVDNNGAINGYYKMCHGADEHVTDKMTDAQLFVHRGNWLFTEIMTDQVFFLTKNYRVQCEKFKALLERVRVGSATENDAVNMMKLHHTFYKMDKKFKESIENDKKTLLRAFCCIPASCVVLPPVASCGKVYKSLIHIRRNVHKKIKYQ